MKNTKPNLSQVFNYLTFPFVTLGLSKNGSGENKAKPLSLGAFVLGQRLNLIKLNKNKQIKTNKSVENNNVFITENSVHFDKNVIIKENSKFLPKIKNSVQEYQTEKNKDNLCPRTAGPLEGKQNIVFNPKKVEVRKLNTNKKGSLINNKVIEQLKTYNINTINSNNKLQIYKKNTIISQYLNALSIYHNKINTGPNLSKKYGILLKYNKIISYNFLQNKTVLFKNGYLETPTEGRVNPTEQLEKINREIIEETYKLLFIYFKSIYCLISKPVISITPDKVNIQLFYYLNIPKKKIIKLFAIHYLNSFKNKWLNISKNKNKKNKYLLNNYISTFAFAKAKVNKIRLPFINGKARKSISRLKSKSSLIKNILFNLIKINIAKVFSYKFKLICELLSSKFNKPVELELIRLHNPYLDTNILANLLHLIIKNKRKKPKIAIDKIYNKNQVKKLNDPNLISVNNKPAFFSGLNFYINGRTMGEAIVPRMTTKTFEKGATATGKVNLLDKSTITKKNKKGAYTIKVVSAQNFF